MFLRVPPEYVFRDHSWRAWEIHVVMEIEPSLGERDREQTDRDKAKRRKKKEK